jgi:prepilin-type N-terminal cleavage/methylation domain-containing protein
MRHESTHLRDAGNRRVGRGGDRGFTLIEILIVIVILGILASIVIPQFSNAAHSARENTLKDDLRYLRTQIVVFKAQHRDAAPGYPNGNSRATPTSDLFQAQMTKYSNNKCDTSDSGSATYPFGPYLQKIPANPITGAAKVLVIPNGQAMPATFQGADYGWIYKPETQEIVANSSEKDANGMPYIKY